jgi:hypothetical protein
MSVLKQNARLNVFITGSRPQASMKPTVTGRIGHIYHITKHRGIIGRVKKHIIHWKLELSSNFLYQIFYLVTHSIFSLLSILLDFLMEQDRIATKQIIFYMKQSIQVVMSIKNVFISPKTDNSPMFCYMVDMSYPSSYSWFHALAMSVSFHHLTSVVCLTYVITFSI